MNVTYGGTPLSYDFDAALSAALVRQREQNKTRAIELAAERDCSIRLQSLARSTTSHPSKPKPTLSDGRVYTLEEYPTPTEPELREHIKRYGREGTDGFVRLLSEETGDTDGLVAKSEDANLQESTRKRSRRRSGVKEQVLSLITRSPDLLPSAIADTLNVSDRRVKEILTELAQAA